MEPVIAWLVEEIVGHFIVLVFGIVIAGLLSRWYHMDRVERLEREVAEMKKGRALASGDEADSMRNPAIGDSVSVAGTIRSISNDYQSIHVVLSMTEDRRASWFVEHSDPEAERYRGFAVGRKVRAKGTVKSVSETSMTLEDCELLPEEL